MTIHTKSGKIVTLQVPEDVQLLTQVLESGSFLVQLRTPQGKSLGMFLDPQAVIP